MIAIFSSHPFLWMLAGTTIGGTYLVSACRSRSAIKRFTASIAIGSSMVPLVHASSQRLLQIRPQTAGNGFCFLISANASVYSPCAAFFSGIPVHRDIRTGSLMGGTGLVRIDTVIISIVRIIVFLAPFYLIRKQLFWIGHFCAICLTEFLS